MSESSFALCIGPEGLPVGVLVGLLYCPEWHAWTSYLSGGRTIRAIWKEDMNPPGLECVPLYALPGMGEPWVVQYGVCCHLPFFAYHFPVKEKMDRGDLEG